MISIKHFLLIGAFIPATQVFAAVPTWHIIPNESKLTFTATQNGSPVTGEFQKFTADIAFDQNNLAESHLHVDVFVGSVTASYQDVSDTLKTADWFNIQLFPKAAFDAKEFKKIDNSHYQAMGELTIRNKKLPVTLNYTFEDDTKGTAKAIGYTTIKRTAFDVGTGEWKSTNEIKDDVKIDFTIIAKHQ